MDLTSNEAFGAFIKNMDVEAYDSEFAMFRWNAKTDSQILAEKIGGVGQITGLTVTERGPGGAAKALKVVGTEGSKTFTRPEQGAERAGKHQTCLQPEGRQHLHRMGDPSQRVYLHRKPGDR